MGVWTTLAKSGLFRWDCVRSQGCNPVVVVGLESVECRYQKVEIFSAASEKEPHIYMPGSVG